MLHYLYVHWRHHKCPQWEEEDIQHIVKEGLVMWLCLESLRNKPWNPDTIIGNKNERKKFFLKSAETVWPCWHLDFIQGVLTSACGIWNNEQLFLLDYVTRFFVLLQQSQWSWIQCELCFILKYHNRVWNRVQKRKEVPGV